MIDVELALRWLIQRLTGDAQLQSLIGNRVYRAVAPDDAPRPFVIVHVIGYGQEDASGDRARPMRSTDVLIRCWNSGGDFSSVSPIAQRIDELVHAQAEWQQSGYVVQGGKRLSAAVAIDEIVDGERYVSAGGLYRIYVSQEV